MVSMLMNQTATSSLKEMVELNDQAFQRELSDLKKIFPGRWVAYFSGCLVADGESPETALAAALSMGISPDALLIKFVGRGL